MDIVFSWITQYGYFGLFALLMLGIAGLPVPDETLLTFCGYLISKGRFHPLTAFLTGFAGSSCGISLSYFIGRTYGHRFVLKYGRYLGITAQRLDRVHRWFDRFGPWLLTIGYFIPGVRHVTALVAGMSELRFGFFALFAYSGAAIWVTAFLSLGFVVGEKWKESTAAFHRYALWATGVGVVLIAAAWLIRKGRKAK